MKNGFLNLTIFSLLTFSFSLFAVEIESVDFVHGPHTSELRIRLGDQKVKAVKKHIVENKQILLDVQNASAGPKILRGMDASEFSGSLVYISAYKKPDDPKTIRFALQLRDNVRSRLKRVKNNLVLEVENRFGAFAHSGSVSSPANVAGTGGKASYKDASIDDILTNLVQSGVKRYMGKKISLNVNQVPVTDILKMIADTSGFNIIIDEDVLKQAPLTLSLTNIPWDQALDTILNVRKLIAEKNSNILTVTTVAKATASRIEELKAKSLQEKQEKLVTKVFPISFAKLADMSNILKEYTTEGRGKISIDERTNALIVKDTTEAVERMRKILETLDTQTPQVLIESKIVEAQEGYSREIGFQNGVRLGYDPVSSVPDTQGGASTNSGASASPGFSFSSAPIAGGSFLGLSIGVFRRLVNLDFNLQLMESESKGKIVSSPKVITQNKEAAEIISKEQRSYLINRPDANGNPVPSYEPITADLSLKVTPQVTNDGSISMSVEVTKEGFSSQSTAQGAPPDKSTGSVKTNVLVDNGSTIVIGGIYKVEESSSHSGVPFLKDIPLLGWLFRTPDNKATARSELIIFLTPRIINQEEAGLVERDNSLT